MNPVRLFFASALSCISLISIGVVTGTASAGQADFCGHPSAPVYLVPGAAADCTSTVYRDYRVVIANTYLTNTTNACAGLSPTRGYWTFGDYSCYGGTYFSAWQCASPPCYGYASIIRLSYSAGYYYGWYSWA